MSPEQSSTATGVLTCPQPSHLWLDSLDESDRARVVSTGMAQRSGFTRNAAILVIDVQNYMIGSPDGRGSADDWPSVCPGGVQAVERSASLLDTARAAGMPVFYTVMVLRRDGRDAGGYLRKRKLIDTDGWMIEGTTGAEIVAGLAPHDRDLVLRKNKPSAFFGTPLTGYLQESGVDTVVVIGGSTSNCVRATVIDAASLNYRVVVPADCVIDRFETSHRTTLFDLDRQYADVVQSRDLIDAWSTPSTAVRP